MRPSTVPKPTISSLKMGPAPADTETTFFDAYARPIWFKDADGFIQYTEYDQNTGAVTKSITDVNTNNTSDFMNLPSGWTTPTGGGLPPKTLIALDSLGRPPTLADPPGTVNYTAIN